MKWGQISDGLMMTLPKPKIALSNGKPQWRILDPPPFMPELAQPVKHSKLQQWKRMGKHGWQ